MSKLAGFKKAKKYTINGVELELKPVHLDDESAMILEGDKLAPEKQMRILKKLVRQMLKEAVPDASDDELEECMRLGNLVKFMDAFYDVNGMNDVKHQSQANKLKDAIEQRKQLRGTKSESTEPK